MPYSDQLHLSDKSRPIYKRARRRAKHREHFFDHPKYTEGHPDAFAGTGHTHDKVKVWCKKCFAARLAYERAQDALAGTPRADATIIEHMWDTQPPEAGWIPGRPANCLVHLRDCELQDSLVRAEAGALHAATTRARRRSPRRDSDAPGHRASPRADRRGTPLVDLAESAQAGPSRLGPCDGVNYSPSACLPTQLVAQAAPQHAEHAVYYGPYSTYPSGSQDPQPQWDSGMLLDQAGYTAGAVLQDVIEYPQRAVPLPTLDMHMVEDSMPGAEPHLGYGRLLQALPFPIETLGPGYAQVQGTVTNVADASLPTWHDASTSYVHWQDQAQ